MTYFTLELVPWKEQNNRGIWLVITEEKNCKLFWKIFNSKNILTNILDNIKQAETLLYCLDGGYKTKTQHSLNITVDYRPFGMDTVAKSVKELLATLCPMCIDCSIKLWPVILAVTFEIYQILSLLQMLWRCSKNTHRKPTNCCNKDTDWPNRGWHLGIDTRIIALPTFLLLCEAHFKHLLFVWLYITDIEADLIYVYIYKFLYLIFLKFMT